jgi:hypothetical protein
MNGKENASNNLEKEFRMKDLLDVNKEQKMSVAKGWTGCNEMQVCNCVSKRGG